MNTSQHACNILKAWQLKNLPIFNIALDLALNDCKAPVSDSLLESERKEMLESVLEHIRQGCSSEQLPDYSNAAAITLLRHLSSSRVEEEKSDSMTKNYRQKF